MESLGSLSQGRLSPELPAVGKAQVEVFLAGGPAQKPEKPTLLNSLIFSTLKTLTTASLKGVEIQEKKNNSFMCCSEIPPREFSENSRALNRPCWARQTPC